jgi:hypothetical protein
VKGENTEEMVEGCSARTGRRWERVEGENMDALEELCEREDWEGWEGTRERLHVHHHGMRAPELDAQNKAKLSMNLRIRRPDAHHDAPIPA